MKIRMTRRLLLVLALSMGIGITAPVLGARSHAADENPIAGLKDAKVAFDITAGEPARLLNILNTIDETREGFAQRTEEIAIGRLSRDALRLEKPDDPREGVGF